MKKDFQKKASDFFDKILGENKDAFTCTQGCYKCCITDISVHSWEASVIIEWFLALSDQDKNAYKEIWTQEQNLLSDLNGNDESPCAFLYDKSCSIYDSRPIICRTQGAPLYIGDYIDVCPLNFNDQKIELKDAIHLERLNGISSHLQLLHMEENPQSFERISLKDLKQHLLGM